MDNDDMMEDFLDEEEPLELEPPSFTNIEDTNTKCEKSFGISIDRDNLNSYMNEIPRSRMNVKMDLLKTRTMQVQQVLASKHTEKVRAGKEAHSMNQDLRKRFLGHQKFALSLSICDKEFIQQYKSSNYTVPFLINVEESMDFLSRNLGIDNEKSEKKSTTVTPASRSEFPVAKLQDAQVVEPKIAQISNQNQGCTNNKSLVQSPRPAPFVPSVSRTFFPLKTVKTPDNNKTKNKHPTITITSAPTRCSESPVGIFQDDEDLGPNITSKSNQNQRYTTLQAIRPKPTPTVSGGIFKIISSPCNNTHDKRRIVLTPSPVRFSNGPIGIVRNDQDFGPKKPKLSNQNQRYTSLLQCQRPILPKPTILPKPITTVSTVFNPSSTPLSIPSNIILTPVPLPPQVITPAPVQINAATTNSAVEECDSILGL